MGQLRWGHAMQEALYGPAGFFVSGGGPAAHFRTSAQAGPGFAAAVVRLVESVDLALGHPDPFHLVDMGAGGGELLLAVDALADRSLRRRLRAIAVELAARPPDLPDDIQWRSAPPADVTGMLMATEWLDNVPLDVVDGGRYVMVEPSTGVETLGETVSAEHAAWLDRWWPYPGRAEVGRSRDLAWARAVGTLRRGLAVAVDYGHVRDRRPVDGTLAGFRYGRQVPPIPDGTCDITAHVAMDAVAAAGAEAAAERPYVLIPQRDALRALGVTGRRPPLALASTDPSGYLRALADASGTAELTDPAGLGGHWWLLQPVGLDAPPLELGNLVGDSPLDLRAARAAGSHSASAAWGHMYDPTEPADITLATPTDALHLLRPG